MTSSEIRQSFLDFFRGKQHTIVPSSSLMPDSPNLLFTNAGMNQFVPIFLGQVECPYKPGRAADTQKCIRAGGKHNDLDDVGLDTYHHTFFEMLGNWSFGDYFKKEAIAWSWELIVSVWKFPAERVYATIYQPDPGDPAERDQEAWEHWAEKFRSVGLDPDIHIVNGNRKDNFWMMGETGPCGPCTEIHVDLTPGPVRTSVERQREGAKLVNGPTAACIEIWNNVFIQYNANPDGTFSPLPAQHVDTGMGFERVVSIIHGTKNFTDFETARISNYETDVFRPLFGEIEKLSGRKYGSTLPPEGSTGETEQEKVDVAFRVIADHIRTLSFSIADGIVPGNNDRNYVLRRILRRAVRYGRTLGFSEPFFYKLVDTLADRMGDVFPELKQRKDFVKQTLKIEEEAFNRTLDKGIALFETEADRIPHYEKPHDEMEARTPASGCDLGDGLHCGIISGAFAFRLYDEQGFPFDLTELMARERGLAVDKVGFEKLMEEQRERARAAQKKTIIKLSEIETREPTRFLGYDTAETETKVLEVVHMGDKAAVVLEASPFYAEMGGQLGDTGTLLSGAEIIPVLNTQKSGNTWLHLVDSETNLEPGSVVTAKIDPQRRAAISRHHSVTHLLHWALHEVVSSEARQKGSYVGPEKLTFDFNAAALTPQQIADVERLVNERIVENAPIAWQEVKYSRVRDRADIMQAFGEKYGETVRVVQIGGHAAGLDGYSMELCGGTHTRGTGEIGLFRIAGEAATGAGIRRIEAIAGLTAYEQAVHESARLRAVAAKLGSPLPDLEKKLDLLVEHAKALEKSLKAAQQREAAGRAKELLSKAENHAVIASLGEMDADAAMSLLDALKSQFNGIIVLGASSGGNVTLLAAVSKEHQARIQAGKIIQAIAPIVGGKGGGKPDFARGGGKDASRLDAALAEARRLIG
ncbi:MAG: alanine--tRNA ligase [Verrucomicrobiales bacterium]|nr:alanine--tRNA ligase [Verrucomicrobiales bacterium]